MLDIQNLTNMGTQIVIQNINQKSENGISI